MIELTLHEHWILNCLVRNRAHFFYDSIDYKNAPDINALKDLYLNHFEQLLSKPIKIVKSGTVDSIEHQANTIIDNLLSLDPNSYKNKKEKRGNYQVIDVY